MVKAILLGANIISNIDQYMKLYKVVTAFSAKSERRQLIKTKDGWRVKPPVGSPAVLTNVIATVEALQDNYLSYTK